MGVWVWVGVFGCMGVGVGVDVDVDVGVCGCECVNCQRTEIAVELLAVTVTACGEPEGAS